MQKLRMIDGSVRPGGGAYTGLTPDILTCYCEFGPSAGPLVPWSVALPSSAPHITEEFQRPVVANIKSQLKRIKTNEKARQRNKATKSALKTSIRRFRDAADAGEVAQATELAQAASRALDKAASKGIIHKNQAANRKSAVAAMAARVEVSGKKPRKEAASGRTSGRKGTASARKTASSGAGRKR
jgi:small subunit ribosomal protein S20